MDVGITDFISDENTPLLFAIALFYAAIGGANINFRARIVLIYSFTSVVVLFGFVDFASVLLGSCFILFLLFEVFNPDEDLVTYFSFGYKVIDFCYRFIIEYYGWLYCLILCLLHWISSMRPETPIYYLVSIALVTILAVFVSRAKFSSKPVSDIYKVLLNIPDTDYARYRRVQEKIDILLAKEDRDYFKRKEFQHSITLRRAIRGVGSRLSLKRFLNPIRNVKSLFSRGYSTIEMQLIRTIGLEYGSYKHTVRRKIFELLYANMVINSYIKRLDKDSDARKNIRYWILANYIQNVSVKYGIHEIYPTSENGSLELLYGKSGTGSALENVSREEFFVWCLGLPHYKKGVGENAIEIHKAIIEEFDLDVEKIRDAIRLVNERCAAR